MALGADTAKNSCLVSYSFQQTGVKVQLPKQIFNPGDMPIVVALVHLREYHLLDVPVVNAVNSLPSLAHPSKKEGKNCQYNCQSLSPIKIKLVQTTGSMAKPELNSHTVW